MSTKKNTQPKTSKSEDKEPKKWNGRKKLPVELNRNKHRIKVGFTLDELNIAKNNAQSSGNNLTAFIRLAALQIPTSKSKDLKLTPKIDREILMQLSKIGNNTNQIARKMNEEKKVYTSEILKNQKQITQLIQEIISKLS